MNRCEIEADPYARAEYDKAWDELSRAWEHGGREHEPTLVLEANTKRADSEYFDRLSTVRESDPNYARKCELEREQRPRSLGPWSPEADVRAFVANRNRCEREFVELQLSNPKLRDLLVARRRARANYDFFTREK